MNYFWGRLLNRFLILKFKVVVINIGKDNWLRSDYCNTGEAPK